MTQSPSSSKFSSNKLIDYARQLIVVKPCNYSNRCYNFLRRKVLMIDQLVIGPQIDEPLIGQIEFDDIISEIHY